MAAQARSSALLPQVTLAGPMPRIFVTQPIPDAPLSRLRRVADVQVFPDSSRILPYEELLRGVAACDILYCLLHDRVDKAVVDAGERLKLIATSAVTPSNIDVGAATSRNIPVTVVSNIVVEETADLQWGLLLAAARRIPRAEAALRTGVFPGAQSMFLAGSRVHGKTLGTIGLGAIGRSIVRRARGFGMRILYTKRTRLSPQDEVALAVAFRPLHDLLRESDFVCVNANYHPGTRHLLGGDELKLLKPTAFLINTARGPIVDERALADALKARALMGAGLDVYEHEPRVHPDLFALENVVLTPHIGTATREMREELASMVVRNILAFMEGARPPNLYNPEVFTQ
jgi:glyoxylate reductase